MLSLEVYQALVTSGVEKLRPGCPAPRYYTHFFTNGEHYHAQAPRRVMQATQSSRLLNIFDVAMLSRIHTF